MPTHAVPLSQLPGPHPPGWSCDRQAGYDRDVLHVGKLVDETPVAGQADLSGSSERYRGSQNTRDSMLRPRALL